MSINIDYYLRAARAAGFSEAVQLENTGLRCNPELRALCTPEQCPKYGTNWVCPPGCGSLEECQRNLDGAKTGLLLQSVVEINVSENLDKLEGLSRQHNLRLRKFVNGMRRDGLDPLPLTTGGCVVCEACAFPQPCRNPDTRMHSLSAYGIDVGEVCRAAGIPFAFSNDVLRYVALVLL